MSLRLKFNLILISVCIIGLVLSGIFSYNVQRESARKEALDLAALIMESALSVRSYTINEVRSVVNHDPSAGHGFIKQTVPAYAATQFINKLQENYLDYSYKEAVNNPTNPTNRALDWEADIIQYFKTHDEKQLIGERDTPMGRYLYLSRPIKITNPGCLTCHSEPSLAPASMIERYGKTNGFGWQLNETIGTQVVTVPLDVALQRAKKEFTVFMTVMASIFAVIIIVLNILLGRYVINPVARMAEHVDKVSMGSEDLPELKVSGQDEIATLGRSFNRMQRSLDNAVQMLDQTMK